MKYGALLLSPHYLPPLPSLPPSLPPSLSPSLLLSLPSFLPYLPCASGASQVMDVVETMQRLEELRNRKEQLAAREKELDEQQHRMEQCLKNITEDTTNEQYPVEMVKFS